MPAGLLVRLRPVGPWRIGPDSGDRDRVDRIYHSDSLYSAVCGAMLRLGQLDQWLDATARSPLAEVRFSSCFPFQASTLYVVAPRSLWPPPASSKVRWKGARFVPLSVVESLVAGRALSDENWMIDGPSECLMAQGAAPAGGPFRVAVRSSAAVDRTGVSVAPHSTACLEFTPSSGFWFLVSFLDDDAKDRWAAPVETALRLLADSGFGGGRSRGWGRSEMPEVTAGSIPDLLFRKSPLPAAMEPQATGYWLLSLFHPGHADQVDWSQGSYALSTRGGRVESPSSWGDSKAPTRMVAEGSVLVSAAEPGGSASDVAPEGFAHPVYRAGFAVSIPIPYKHAEARLA